MGEVPNYQPVGHRQSPTGFLGQKEKVTPVCPQFQQPQTQEVLKKLVTLMKCHSFKEFLDSKRKQ